MRRVSQVGWPVLLLASALVWCAGCTTTQKTVAFKSLSVVANTVDAALKPYVERVVAGTVDQGTQIKVNDAKGKYEVAFKAAVSAARGNLEAPTPADVQKLADDLTALLNAVLKK